MTAVQTIQQQQPKSRRSPSHVCINKEINKMYTKEDVFFNLSEKTLLFIIALATPQPSFQRATSVQQQEVEYCDFL